MTPAAELLASEIERSGPIPFRRFMEVALYHPDDGYYRRPRDPFGTQGDFFTTEQLQPVFGILIAARIRQLCRALGEPPDFTVVELGAGRREMAPHLSEWPYVPIDVDVAQCQLSVPDALRERFCGVVFSNEFFDALPVDVAVFTENEFCQELVTFSEGRFHWIPGPPVSPQVDHYLRRYFPPPEEGRRYEVNLDALSWIDRISGALRSGFVLTIDYGYTRAESVRFPAGTLMGYRRHTAREDVLCDPGARDITAHVNFTALEERAAARGLALEKFETLAQTLLAAGEPDQFASVLAEGEDALRRRMQLKTLLFGMGETFRVQLLHRSL